MRAARTPVTGRVWQSTRNGEMSDRDARTVCFIPLANGKGWTDFDNPRVAVYEGSEVQWLVACWLDATSNTKSVLAK